MWTDAARDLPWRTSSRSPAPPVSRPTALLLLLALAAACAGGAGPQADRSKAPAQIETEARDHDRPRLERIVADYRGAIASREGELAELEADVREQAGGVIDAVLGTGPNDGVRAEVQELKASVQALGAELRALHERLAIYTRELASRD